MMACETWLARDYLLRHRRDPGPPCDHSAEHCPPLAEVVPAKPTTTEAADVPR